jgi:hypothetical protein
LHIHNAEPEHGRNCDRLEPNDRRIAVLACHGMGQQVCYETVDSVATAICGQVCPENGWRVSDVPKVRVAQLGDLQLGRVELRLSDDITSREVHVYEAYWAPLTQGRICLTETVGFLFRSGFDGMRHWAAEKGWFAWRVFADNRKEAPIQKEHVKPWVPLILAMVVAVIGFLLFFGASILTFGVAWILNVAGAPDELCHGLATAVILLGTAISAVLAAVVISGSTAAFPSVFSWLGKHYVGASVALYVVAAAAFFLLPFSGTDYYKEEFSRLRAGIGERLKSGGGMFCFAVSPLVMYAWSKLRYFLLEFVGDVAIYVSASRLNRYWEVREQIQQLCRKITGAIYKEKDRDGRHVYDEIIVLGHSLGSAVAYHALNAVLVSDALQPSTEPLDAAKRTSLFLTFGSPLDKITYLFRAQGTKPNEASGNCHRPKNDNRPGPGLAGASGDSTFRDAVDSAFAPLASCSSTRWQIPWTNIWAPGDIISGALNYFDRAKRCQGDPPAVDNKEEKRASSWNPLGAHTCYWTQPTFAHAIFKAITKGKDRWPPAPTGERQTPMAAGVS